MRQKGYVKHPVLLMIVLLTTLLFAGYYLAKSQSPTKSEDIVTQTKREIVSKVNQKIEDITTKKPVYHQINIYALPLGDDKYTTIAKKGYIMTCQKDFNGTGAFKQGPWVNESAGTWDLSRKIKVGGSANHKDANINISNIGVTRIITGNSLPNHATGTFPISTSDSAYQFDKNPNAISAHNINLRVPINPSELVSPQCVAGEVGIMLTGAILFSAFDAGGKDALAHELQDSCQGHPQESGFYHYHGLSSCLNDTQAEGSHSNLVGYAFDGFGIYGDKGEYGMEISTEDLDECHGHTHKVNWDGINKEMYHYHLTQDFPYSVSCFKGKPSVKSLTFRPPQPLNKF